ncbi:filamentous hemagglutinin N-terminal domain-containing protein [Alkalinema pantanalense CENA528]|uniref:two-partner secretion domain-containing protein n=1 Tax=Alkalinema pantanalense TaxID=1620705 RepID=UPI003D6F2FB0
MRRRMVDASLFAIGLLSVTALSTLAQVSPDGSLSTTVNATGNNFTINNGNLVGGNLFHSFSQFSVPTGGSAFFNNALTVQNIFARVTGGTASNIDGLIKANGTANLFLLNPSGVLFGPNTSLNLGGSFVGTTASSVQFADGTTFGSVNAGTPLLTISAPIGLQMGSNPGSITVQGSGHNGQLSESQQVFGLTLGTRGLQVKPGKTLALVGGDITLNGGLLSAPHGRIELGSVTQGTITLTENPQGFVLSYPQASNFGNIQMNQRALASTRNATTGGWSGPIQIQGKQVSLREGSLVLVQNRANQTGGDITVNATESLQIVGKSPDFRSSSSLVNETVAAGAAGHIYINTPNVLVDQGGFILDRTFSSAPSGNIIINTTNMQVSGFAAGDPNAFRSVSQILSSTYSSGKGGSIAITTQNLSVLAGANVAARPYSTGNGGNLTVNADTIQVSTEGAPKGNYFSLLSAATFGSGNAGNLTIDTQTLSVEAGGRVSASSIILGNAGNLTINASESINVTGVRDSANPSYIGTAVRPVSNPNSRGVSGDTTINTPILRISDGATVFVQNLGLGQAGNLTINADTIQLKNQASISASTRASGGGNINLQVRDLLLMRYGSFINATAGGQGNGGNITLSAPVIVGLENSDIIANAFRGRGGNINITTQGILGLKFRDRLTPENDITASSEFGVSGNVQVNTIGTDLNAGLTELPANISDPSQKIATGCATTQGSQFIATGRGGLPQNPNQEVQNNRTWKDLRDLSAYRNKSATVALVAAEPPRLVQASGFQRKADGTIALVASPVPVNIPTIATCSIQSLKTAHTL